MQNNTLSRAELDAAGDVLDIHYGDVLIKYGSVLDATDNTIPHIISGHESANYAYLQDGDIIVADTAEDETVGKTVELLNVSDRKIEAGLHTVPCRPLFPFASKYLGYYMNSPHYHKQLIPLMQGIKVLSISKGNISKTEITSPQTIAEQEKISHFLYLLDQRAATQCKIIDALKKYKRGLLMHYFSDDQAQQWTHYSVSQIGKVITGSTPPTNDKSNYDGDLLFCSPGDVGEEKYISSTEKRVSPKGFASGRPLPPNSIIVTCIGLIGKLGIATTNMITNQQINALVVSEGFDHEFIYYAFENFFPEYRSKVSMQTLPILSKSEFEKLIVKAPVLDVQLKISSHLAAMDRKLEYTQKELKVLLEQRRGLMQQLFI